MRIKNSYKFIFLIAFAIIWQGRSGGPGTVGTLEVTGAPGSNGNVGTCANSGCHNSGTFDPVLTVELTLEGSDDPLTEYLPGETYLVNFTFSSNDGTIGHTGFQAVALDNSDANIGSWNNTLSAMQTVNLSGREYLEHSQAVNFPKWNSFWIAPPEGSGDVTFYAAGIAANNDGTAGGDGVAAASLTVSEGEPSSISQIDRDFAAITIAPNPVIDEVKVSISSEVRDDFQLNIFDIAGQKVHSEDIYLQVGQNEKNLNFVDLQSGMYFLQLINADRMTTHQLIKL